MKRLLFLLPILLLIFNVTHFSPHKDNVNYVSNGTLYALQPAHWHQEKVTVTQPLNPHMRSAIIVGNAGIAPLSLPLSHSATFNGFPFGFYFVTHIAHDSSYGDAATTISAFSWLWFIVDGAIIIITFLFAVLLNRQRKVKKKHDGLVTGKEHPTDQVHDDQ